MSHIVSIKTQLRDLAAIKAACTRLGWEFLEGQTTYAWYGHWVGDSPMPADITTEDMGKCTHAIRVPGATYEVGLVQQPGGYAIRYDYFCSGGLLEPMGGEHGERFRQAYAVEKAKLEARKKGHTYSERVTKDGSIQLTITTGR